MLTKTKTLVRNEKFQDYRHIYDGKHNLTCILCVMNLFPTTTKKTCKVFIRICVCVQKLFCKGIIKRFEKLQKIYKLS